jgi:hypothetical protein
MKAIRLTAAAMIVALAATLAGCVPNPPAPTCPTAHSGTWTGTWRSNNGPNGGTINANLTFSGATVSGTMSMTGSVYTTGNVTGTVSCGQLSVGVFSGAVNYTGVISADGRSVSGTYSAPQANNDAGTFTVTTTAP